MKERLCSPIKFFSLIHVVHVVAHEKRNLFDIETYSTVQNLIYRAFTKVVSPFFGFSSNRYNTVTYFGEPILASNKNPPTKIKCFTVYC